MTYTPYPRHRNLVRGRSFDFLEIIGISRISLSTHDSPSHDSPIHHPVVPVPVVPVDSLARGHDDEDDTPRRHGNRQSCSPQRLRPPSFARYASRDDLATDPERTRDGLDSTRLDSRRLARRSMRSIDRSIDDSTRGFFAPFDAEADGWMLTRSVIRISRVRRGRRERSSSSKINTDAIRARDSGSGSERLGRGGGGIGESRSRGGWERYGRYLADLID